MTNAAPSFLTFCATALGLLFASGCAQQQLHTANTLPLSWAKHETNIQAIDHWRVQGKLGYRNSESKGSAWFDWTQRGEKFTIYLSGPFGAGTVKISSTPMGVTLSQPGEENLSAPSSAALTEKLFGWHLPVEQLRYWVKGIPAKFSPSTLETFNEQGLIETLVQDNWEINIGPYQTHPKGKLPGKIKGISDGLAFTLLLKDWSFPNNVE